MTYVWVWDYVGFGRGCCVVFTNRVQYEVSAWVIVSTDIVLNT